MKRCSLFLACLGLLANVGHVTADEPPAKPKPSDKTIQLQSKVDQLTARIRELEYPELRKRDAAEIPILEQWVKAAEGEYDRQIYLRLFSDGGGSLVNRVRCGRYRANARVELAWAKRDVRGAVVHAADALAYARAEENAAIVAFEVGQSNLQMFQKSQLARFHANSTLTRARRIAALLGVDVADVHVPDIRKRMEEEERKLRKDQRERFEKNFK